MALADLWKRCMLTYSVELLPPLKRKTYQEGHHSTEDLGRITKVIKKGVELGHLVQAASITEGAGGNNCRFGTEKVAEGLQEHYQDEEYLKKHGSTEVIAHLTCVNSRREDVDLKISKYFSSGIENILALRGDLPKDETARSDFKYASDLVKYIKGKNSNVLIGVAAHPEGYDCDKRSRDICIDHAAAILKVKQENGADYAVTQMVFDLDIYEAFVEKARKKGVKIPIVAGVSLVNPDAKSSIYKLCTMAVDKFNVSVPFIGELKDDSEEDKRIIYDKTLKLCLDLRQKDTAGLHMFISNNVPYAKRFIEDLLQH